MASHFLPDNRYKQFDSPFSTSNNVRYEGVKSSFTADLLATESCLGKCQEANNTSNNMFST